jgi:hypothetical protein
MQAAKAGIQSGVHVALVGRWVLGLMRGQFVHANINSATPVACEKQLGWAFHLVLAGGALALLYPVFFQVVGHFLTSSHVLGGVLFGLLTSLLPWFVLLPSFGWGFLGRRAPHGAKPLVASTLSHVCYGLGVGGVIAALAS